jgi:hypothetical protein
MAPRPLTDVLRTRILEEVKLWAARRYDERANAISPAAVDIAPATSDDADYLVHLDLSHIPNAPDSVQIQVVVEPDGNICLATGD